MRKNLQKDIAEPLEKGEKSKMQKFDTERLLLI